MYQGLFQHASFSNISASSSCRERDVQQAAKTAEQEWPLLGLMWPMQEDFCPSLALCGYFGFHNGTLFLFFFPLKSQGLANIAEYGTLISFPIITWMALV